MKYTFPVINTIDDVLPVIEGNEEFIVIRKDDYTVIDYILQGPHTFPKVFNGTYDLDDRKNAIKRECRGLIFDKQGKLISRAFHKFFNYGEKPEEQAHMGAPEFMLEKLDGSMIRPLVINGDIRLATRKGITDVAMQAEEFAAGKENYITLISSLCNAGYTPIFEWCSRKNQIVLDYPEDNLVLLAVRKTDTGIYMGHKEIQQLGTQFELPVVQAFDFDHLNPFIAAKDEVDKEGYVFVFEDGHKLKAKSDWYVTLHRAKEAIGREKDLIKAYLTTGVDDILPILPDKFREEVASFLARLTEQVVATSQRLDGIFVNIINKLPDQFTRKDFALHVLNLDPKYKSFMFAMLPGTPTLEIVIPALLKACQSKKVLDEHRWLIGGIRYGEKEVEAA